MMFTPSCQLSMSLPTAHRGGGGEAQPSARMEGGRNKINHMTKPTGGGGGRRKPTPRGGGGGLEPWNIYMYTYVYIYIYIYVYIYLYLRLPACGSEDLSIADLRI